MCPLITFEYWKHVFSVMGKRRTLKIMHDRGQGVRVVKESPGEPGRKCEEVEAPVFMGGPQCPRSVGW